MQLIYQCWQNHAFSTLKQEFLFLLITNRLQTADRLHNHTNIAKQCVFCINNYNKIRQESLREEQGPCELESEKYLHLFFKCKTVSLLATKVVGFEWNPTNAFGLNCGNNRAKQLRIMNSSDMLYKIWNCRNSGINPTLSRLRLSG